jgi:hypothetical protein
LSLVLHRSKTDSLWVSQAGSMLRTRASRTRLGGSQTHLWPRWMKWTATNQNRM